MIARTPALNADCSAAVAEYQRGDRLREIATRHGVTVGTVSLWAKKAGVSRRPQGCRRKPIPSPRDLAILRAVRAGGQTLEQIGEKYGLTRARVHFVYHKWKDCKIEAPFAVGDKVRFMGDDYEVVSADVHDGRVRSLRGGKETTIPWKLGDEHAVKL